MTVVVTGAEGFIGRNLLLKLRESSYTDIAAVTRATTAEDLRKVMETASFVFHLAGVNRPQDPADFECGNVGFTATLCALMEATGRQIPIAFSSSTQAEFDNSYGASKRKAEAIISSYGKRTSSTVHIFRLPNVFGKWARPNYNSAIATFCHNVARGLPITINNPASPLKLVYIDDVADAFIKLLKEPNKANDYQVVSPVFETTVGEIADTIRGFALARDSLFAPRSGKGLVRALHSTYLSYLPPDAFSYRVPRHEDPRGVFVEMLKTPDCGQFSYFTAHPGVTRGEHYHHTKSEKFLVISGTAHFGFRHVDTGETYELVVNGEEARIVETAPGWAHNITNCGSGEMVVLLWANEVFDRERPDTFPMKVRS